VRQVDRGDLDAVARTLGAAFADDPVWRWLITGDRQPATRIGRALSGVTEMYRRHRTCWMTEDGAAVAVWAPPGHDHVGLRQFVPAAPRFLAALGRRGISRLGAMNELEREHPPQPCWYLAAVGTDPLRQGRGLGAATLAPALNRADRAGVGAYLEATREENVPFYERLGFRVTSTFDLARGAGPRLWLMWREPRPAGGELRAAVTP
jgi:GNAT superfamily N-acetyltransferase